MNKERLLIISLFGGVLMASLSWFTLSRMKHRIESRYVLTTVLRVKKYIPQGARISMEDVQDVSIPDSFLEPHAIKSLDELKKRVVKGHLKARLEIHKGEQLTGPKLIDETTLASLSWVLAPDQVATTLRLNPEDSVGGFLHPGDWVSVFSTVDPQPGWKESQTLLTLPRVQVVGVQNKILDPTLSSVVIEQDKNTGDGIYFVTLGLSHKEAGKLILASQKGHVSLGLNSSLGERETFPFSIHLNQLNL